MKPKRKMKHLIFQNEITVWVKSIYESEFIFLQRSGFLGQMKAYKEYYDSPTDAREYAAKLAEEKIKNLNFSISMLKDAIKAVT